MEFITYILAAVVSYLGIICGAFLAYANIDELKPGKKYFILGQKIVLAIILILTLFILMPNVFNLIIFAFAALLILIQIIAGKETPLPVVYPLLGAVFYISSGQLDFFAASSSLIFLFGILSGTISKISSSGKIKKGIPKEIVYALGFFVSIIFFFL